MVSLAAPVAALPPATASAVPGSSLKRRHTGSDADHGQVTDYNKKRPRVSFDPSVDIRILEDFDDKGIELVREEVRRGIEKHIAGDSTSYDQIKALFLTRPTARDAPSTKLLGKYVMALVGNVSFLGRNCSGLVHAILDCQWLVRDAEFKRLYTMLLASIMSAHGGYGGQILRSLVKYFVQLPSPNIRHTRDPPIGRPELRQRVHETLRYLLALIPSASGVLTTIIVSSFPDLYDPAKMYIEYIKNLMDLMEYAPELKGTVLSLVTQKMVRVDVQLQVDLEDLEEELADSLVQEAVYNHEENEGGYDDDDDDSDASDDESVSSDDSLDDDDRRIKDLKDSVGKLDSIMDILFEYYHRIFVKSTHVDAAETFEFLLSQFTNTILPNQGSRHAQFLLFHYAQTSQVFIAQFATKCAAISIDKTRPQITRIAATGYLASFLARGAHVPAQTVRDIFELLGQYLEHFRSTHEANCKGPDLQRYGYYYAMAQAMLYMFCFRWRDLIISETDDYADDEDILFQGGELRWLPGIKENMMRNIYSKLNPLKICSPTVVTQFARIAHHLRFVYVFPLLETNKRLRLSRTVSAVMYGMQERETALTAKNSESVLQLDSYFPFDPYNLPKSKRWMAGDYNEWKSMSCLEQEEGDDNSDTDSQADESEDEQDFEDGTATEVSA